MAFFLSISNSLSLSSLSSLLSHVSSPPSSLLFPLSSLLSPLFSLISLTLSSRVVPLLLVWTRLIHSFFPPGPCYEEAIINARFVNNLSEYEDLDGTVSSNHTCLSPQSFPMMFSTPNLNITFWIRGASLGYFSLSHTLSISISLSLLDYPVSLFLWLSFSRFRILSLILHFPLIFLFPFYFYNWWTRSVIFFSFHFFHSMFPR